MKKLLSIFLISILLGCTTNTNTPKEEVKNFFSKYTSLDNEVTNQLNEVVNSNNFNNAQKDEYITVFKRQYRDFKYNIKDEKINGNNAVVTVQIEVYDFNLEKQAADTYLEEHPNAFNNAEGTFDKNEFIDYKLNAMKKTTNRKKHTLDLSLTKIEDDWRLDNLSDAELEKIHGLFQG